MCCLSAFGIYWLFRKESCPDYKVDICDEFGMLRLYAYILLQCAVDRRENQMRILIVIPAHFSADCVVSGNNINVGNAMFRKEFQYE